MKLSTRLATVGAVAVVGAVGMSATSTAGKDDKVTICHADTLDDGTVQFDTITISRNALSAHLDNHEGDYLGACEEVATTTTTVADTTTTVAEETTTTVVEETTTTVADTTTTVAEETTTTVAEETTTTVAAETTTTVADTTTTQPAVVVEPPDPTVVDPAEDEPALLLLPATR